MGRGVAPAASGGSSRTPFRDRRSRGGIIGVAAVVIIVLVLLLNVTGQVSWKVWWGLARFWPVWLVLLVMNIVLGWSRIGKIVARALTLAVFVFLLFVSTCVVSPGIFENHGLPVPEWAAKLAGYAEKDADERLEKRFVLGKGRYEDIDARSVSLDVGYGKLFLKDGEGGEFVEVEARYYENWGEPRFRHSAREGVLSLAVETGHEKGAFPRISEKSPEYRVILGRPGLATDLKLHVGAGKAVVDLGQVKAHRIIADVDAGELVMTLGKGALPGFAMEIDVKAGEVELILPGGTGYKLRYSVGLGSIEIEGKESSRLGGRERSYTSPSYAGARKKILVEADVGVGSFKISSAR